jgi:hypothetical protein
MLLRYSFRISIPSFQWRRPAAPNVFPTCAFFTDPFPTSWMPKVVQRACLFPLLVVTFTRTWQSAVSSISSNLLIPVFVRDLGWYSHVLLLTHSTYNHVRCSFIPTFLGRRIS